MCRDCGRPGEVLLCEGCDACYHIECVNLPTIPEGRWFCSVCELHASRGALDLQQLAETVVRHRLRISTLGYDRHGRMFWFFVNRVFV